MATKSLYSRIIEKYTEGVRGNRSDNINERRDSAALVAVKNIASLLLAAMYGMSEGPFGSFPFGIALLAASDRYIPAMYIGLLLSSLFNRGLAVSSAIVYTLVIILRLALGRLAFELSRPQTATRSKAKSNLSASANTADKLSTQDKFAPTDTSFSASKRRPDSATAGTGFGAAHARSGTIHDSSARSKRSNGKIAPRKSFLDSVKATIAENGGLRGLLFAGAVTDDNTARTRQAIFGESILLRCTTSCAAAFIFGLYRLVAGGYLYYDLFGMVFAFFVSPLLTLGLALLYSRDERLARWCDLGVATFIFVTIYALRGYSLFGFTPAFAVSLLAALWVSAKQGGMRGCAAGLIAGIACGRSFDSGLGGEVVLVSAPYIAAAVGLVGGTLWKFSKAIAAAAVCVVSLILGYSADGFTALTTILPDTLGAVTIFMPLYTFGLLPALPSFASPVVDRDGELAIINEKKQMDTIKRMNSLSEALGRLSDVIYTLSDRLRRPGIIDLKQICDNSFDKYCQKCSLASLCFERECTSTLDAQSKITTELYKKGRVEPDDVPSFLRDRCYNIVNIVNLMNTETAELIERLIKGDKTEAFALDYESLSRLLAQSIEQNDAEYRIDSELTSRLGRSLRYMGMSGARALCFGQRKKQVIISGVELAAMRMGAQEICLAAERILHTKLTRPKFNIDGDKVEISMTAGRSFTAESARASSRCESESANGDTAMMFETGEDYFYCLISDGMGSGREAAMTSKLCALFCEQLLSGGNGKAITLEMLNGFIRNRGEECSATIDPAEIDLINGHACFVKSGAAPSYILRQGNLYKLQSKTVPIGIMPALDAEQIKFDLEEGDVIIMLSDGVAQSLEDGVWLANLLTYEWEDNLDLMAEKIVDNAALNNRRSDDMTAALIRISGGYDPRAGTTRGNSQGLA